MCTILALLVNYNLQKQKKNKEVQRSVMSKNLLFFAASFPTKL
jgi:hypothetical protein